MAKHTKKILVVDDDESIRTICEEVLSVAGYKVEKAAHGMDGLDMLKKTDYDLVISDVNMPELDGLDMYRCTVNGNPGMADRFIFITGFVTSDLESIISKRDVKCLTKPFKITDLLGCVDNVIVKSMKDPSKAETGKRAEERFSLEMECDVFDEEGHRFIIAGANDLSRTGLKISYAVPPLKAGAEVNIYMNVNGLSLQRKGRIAWTSETPDGCASGLKLEKPMPVSSIINFLPVRCAN